MTSPPHAHNPIAIISFINTVLHTDHSVVAADMCRTTTDGQTRKKGVAHT